jgi:DNA-binding NarL/FixJ family response regulator
MEHIDPAKAKVLDGIRAALAPHCEIAGTAADGSALVEAALCLKPDLIIADITMPHLSGIDAAHQIKTSLPGIKLLFVTTHSSSAYVRAAFEAGGTGYVVKSAIPEELLDAVKSVLNGGTYVSPSLSLGAGPDGSGTPRRSAGVPRAGPFPLP